MLLKNFHRFSPFRIWVVFVFVNFVEGFTKEIRFSYAA